MAIKIPDGVIKTYKKGVDIASILNQADVTALTNLSLQSRCLFEIIIYPEKFGVGAGGGLDFKQVALDALGSVVMRLYITAINDIPLIGLDYQRSGGMNWVKDMIYPDTLNITFLETGMGNVKGYFKKWQETIVTYDKVTRDYVFSDNQSKSKRSAIIIPQQSDVLPSTEWIFIEGLKYKTLTGISYDHSSGENEVLTAEFSVDNIRIDGISLSDLNPF